MRTDYEVFVFSTDRDLGDHAPYKDVNVDQWISKDFNLQLFYASPGFLNWKNILLLIKKVKPDFIYVNSMFSKYFSLYPLMMKRMGIISAEIVLAPRGMLKESALAFKYWKKKTFLNLFRTLNIHRIIRFHATDSKELNDIKELFGAGVDVRQLTNFPGVQKPFSPLPGKAPGDVKMIFVGRIHPVKNLAFLLDCLTDVKYKVELTVIGAMEDQQYWDICNDRISKLASHINVHFINDVPHKQMENLLLKHHLFVLPTKGENFGHAIYEALACGRPVLISDQTPWRNLERKMAGWDLPLTDKKGFQFIINKVAAMDLEELNIYCRQAWQFCNDFIKDADIKKEYLKLFT